ncbi:MAG: radical SAM family heme chaperone HemW [Firmicutes bacterium]|nr:radical SAM family heme chaperone HemW [Bacillota bacterium]
MDKSLGLYVHIPYCLKKCRYCDFVSYPAGDKLPLSPDEYAYRVCDEIGSAPEEIKKGYEVDSIFFGGGTPSCMGTDMIGRILLAIKDNYSISQVAEISIEANPETVTEKKAKNLKYLGFNRVSMGVQSLNDGILKNLGRVHDSEKALEAYHILRDAGFGNINLDLMFGVPGQSIEIWEDTLDRTIALGPEHISFYSLQIEEGTPFYEEYKEGVLEIPTWEENRKMYELALRKLKDVGYVHYEVSNAAKPGFECRHNLKYWTMKPYLGFGTGAHSFLEGKRFYNTDELEYTREYEEEENTLHERMGDFVFTQLRLIDGIDLKQFKELFGKDFEDVFGELLEDKGLSEYLIIVRDFSGRLAKVALSRKGLDNTNIVLQRFLMAIDNIT